MGFSILRYTLKHGAHIQTQGKSFEFGYQLTFNNMQDCMIAKGDITRFSFPHFLDYRYNPTAILGHHAWLSKEI